MISAVHLFGAKEVRDALRPLADQLDQLGRRIMALQASDRTINYAVAYGTAYRDQRKDIIGATGELIEAMRGDLTAEILDG